MKPCSYCSGQFAVVVFLLICIVSTSTGVVGPAAENDSTAATSSVGITERVPWTTSRVVGTPDPPAPYQTKRVFPKIAFQNPVVVSKAPGTTRWFVGEQAGNIFSFVDSPDAASKDLFLDARELLKKEPVGGSAKAFEAVYGLTFHPNFAENRFCYVCYVLRGEDPNKPLDGGTRVSRFTVTRSDPPVADPASEQVLITWLQGGHNGGCLKFGPDGFLYISTGDGGPAFPPDPLNAGQDVSNLLSSVLRIDVDREENGKKYAIPKDNPFVNLPGARGEVWCYGLRNPWKMSFDRQTGDLWIGDVGWELWELVYRGVPGGNFGWSITEGPQSVHVDRNVGPTPILPPALAIAHSDGVSVTGGFVYRGSRFPELQREYVFGDWETRRIWAAKWDGRQLVGMRDLVEPVVRVVDFAEDEAGELYLLDYDDGTLHSLEKQETGTSDAPFPTKLSETGLFDLLNPMRPSPGVVPFSVQVEQWADFATAERYIAVPGTATIDFYPNQRPIPGSMFQATMSFPKNTVAVKTFSLEMEAGNPASNRPIETQLLHFDGRFWRGYSYEWNEHQSDAELVEAAGRSRKFTVLDASAPGGKRVQTWRYGSRAECARCHNQWAEYTLGFNLRQLDRRHDYGSGNADQLATLEHVRLIRIEEPSGEKPHGKASPRISDPHMRLADLGDASASVEERARSYLHVNCAHCHRNGGGGTAYIELQKELSLDRTKAVAVNPTQGTFGIAGAEIIAPGDPFRSVLFYRMAKTGSGRMPHLGSELVDEKAIRLVHDWIDGMKDIPQRGQASESVIDAAATGESVSDEQIAAWMKSTSDALRLQRAMVRGEMPLAVRNRILDAAGRAQPQIRDLFEQFIPADQRVERLGAAPDLSRLAGIPSDPGRGRDLFFNSMVLQCKTCHQIAGIGGRVGPDLSQIGKKYPKDQLIESILQPSKVIDPKFQSQLVATTDGRVLMGVITERNDKSLTLRDAKDQEIRLAASDVEQVKPSGQSLMPDQLLRDLTLQEAADLIAFLETLR